MTTFSPYSEVLGHRGYTKRSFWHRICHGPCFVGCLIVGTAVVGMPGIAAAATPSYAPFILATAIAQVPDPTVAGVRFGVSGWLFAPAVVNGSVKGFLAWADVVPTIGLNIRLAWHQREANGSWTTWAWTDSDLGAAADYIRTLQQDPTVFSFDSVVSTLADAALGSGTAPAPVVNGLFFDDAFQTIVANSTDPVAIVKTLADVGWPVAPEISAMAVAIVADQESEPIDQVTWLLNGLTADSEVRFFGASTLTVLVPWPCVCVTVDGTPTYGPWVFRFSVSTHGGAQLDCSYKRTVVTPYTSTGETPFWCLDCASPPGATYRTTEFNTTINIDGTCVPPPP